MGLSASQFRYLSLTARKSDLEYQSQMINQARLALATESSNATKAYTAGMSNQVIRVSHDAQINGNSTKIWEELTYANLQSSGYQVIGTNGAALQPCPYTEYIQGGQISAATYNSLPESYKNDDNFAINADGTYSVKKTVRLGTNPTFNGMDIQSLLVSGQGHIVTQSFFNYLCEHGYGTGVYLDKNGKETTYEKLVEEYQNANLNSPTIVDWRSDVSNTFKQTLYTEDDAAVAAKYESTTSEIQSQDKKLELRLKQIESEHKAIQTEMEAVKKVIDKNIEESFKSFG